MKIPGVKEEKKTDRELRVDIDHIISENEYPEQSMINTEGVCWKEIDSWKESSCGKCHADFNSRNELFRHIDKRGTSSAATARRRMSSTSIEWRAAEAGRRPVGEFGITTSYSSIGTRTWRKLMTSTTG